MSPLSLLLVAFLIQAAPVDGTVVKRTTNEPIPKVSLELRAFDTDTVQYAVTTRDDGHFSFANVKPGKYRLRAERPGYVRIEYGQRKLTGRGAAITIDASQSMNGIHLIMTPTGAVNGRIYDASGQPVVKATVQALKVGYPNGRRALSVVQTALANDRGEYRLFWLPPGQYFIGAVMPDWNIAGDNITMSSSGSTTGNSQTSARFSAPLTDPLEPTRFPGTQETGRFLPVYFPNTTDEDAASLIDVGPGANLGGMDIQLTPVRTRRVRGVVIDGDTGAPPTAVPQPAQIIAIPRTSGSGGSPFVDRTTGAFDIQVMQAETYLAASGGLKVGRTTLPFGDKDYDDVRITISSGSNLPGRIVVEGSDPIPVASLKVSLRVDPQTLFSPQPAPDSGAVAANGNFTIQNVTVGDYRVYVAPILNFNNTLAPAIATALHKAYVKSIRYGESDALNEILHLDGRTSNALTIVVATNAGLLNGTVLSDKQEPLPDVTVALVPTNRGRMDLYRSATTDATGAFKIDRIPPGDYKAFAWEDVENGAWFDPQFMRPLDERGIPVHVQEGSQSTIRLPVIP